MRTAAGERCNSAVKISFEIFIPDPKRLLKPSLKKKKKRKKEVNNKINLFIKQHLCKIIIKKRNTVNYSLSVSFEIMAPVLNKPRLALKLLEFVRWVHAGQTLHKSPLIFGSGNVLQRGVGGRGVVDCCRRFLKYVYHDF